MKIYSGNKMAMITELSNMMEYRRFFPNTKPTCLCSLNFVDGRPVGGQRITQEQVDVIVAKAKEVGLKIEA
jgi:hypothetical protein